MDFRSSRGVTLVELMVSVAIISIVAVSLIASFNGIQQGVQLSRDKTLAANLAQEQMQILTQQTYYDVLPTITPSYIDGIPYDPTYFPPQTILEGGVSFQRLTYVQVVTEVGGKIKVLSPTTPDTGMRLLTVTVVWQEHGQTKNLAITSIFSNPNTVETNSSFTGTVIDAATLSAIPGAIVDIAENLGWVASTNGSGSYSVNLSPGSFNLIASAPGYFSGFVYASVGPNQITTVNFNLTKMSSGTVEGTAWIEPSVVISQVVSSTVQPDNFNVEYTEIFNPTVSTFTLSNNGPINLNIVSGNNSLKCTDIQLNYVNATLYPQNYYLIANTNTFVLNGVQYIADAYYASDAASGCNPAAPSSWPPNIMQAGHSGTVYLTDTSNNILDAVGWTNNGHTRTPNYCNGACIYQPANGLPAGDQIVRTSSPSWATGVYGRAYNSGNNSEDFAYPGAIGALNLNGIVYPPFTTASGAQTLIAGVPAVGAVISATDGLSSSTMAVSVSSPPVAQFFLANVATGTWTVLIASRTYELENDTVTIPASGSVYVFPSSTTILLSSATAGFVSGSVLDNFGVPIFNPSAIEVSPGGIGLPTSANTSTGRYLLSIPTTSSILVDVIANPNNTNADYISVSSIAVPVALGEITSGVNFVLSQGGRISGVVTRDGVTPLPDITVTAIDVNGNAQDSEVSDVNGRFTTVNIATGPYTVEPQLDPSETSTPASASVVVLEGQTIFSTTFTITGDMGTITGNVTLGGTPIATGVLVVATVNTLSGPSYALPALSTGTLGFPYYSASSREDGTYSVSVAQSTSPAYNIYGYYPTVSGSGIVTISVKSLTGVQVLAGQTVSGENLAW